MMLLDQDGMPKSEATTKCTKRRDRAAFSLFLDATYLMQKLRMIWISLHGWQV